MTGAFPPSALPPRIFPGPLGSQSGERESSGRSMQMPPGPPESGAPDLLLPAARCRLPPRAPPACAPFLPCTGCLGSSFPSALPPFCFCYRVMRCTRINRGRRQDDTQHDLEKSVIRGDPRISPRAASPPQQQNRHPQGPPVSPITHSPSRTRHHALAITHAPSLVPLCDS